MLDKNILTLNPGRIIKFWRLHWSFHIIEKLRKNLRVKKIIFTITSFYKALQGGTTMSANVVTFVVYTKYNQKYV